MRCIGCLPLLLIVSLAHAQPKSAPSSAPTSQPSPLVFDVPLESSVAPLLPQSAPNSQPQSSPIQPKASASTSLSVAAPPEREPHRSYSAAVALTVFPTLAGYGLLIGGLSSESDARLPLLISGGLLSSVGPSIGNLYLRPSKEGSVGIAIRLLGFGLLADSVPKLGSLSFGGNGKAAVLGAMFVIGATGYDLSSLSKKKP